MQKLVLVALKVASDVLPFKEANVYHNTCHLLSVQGQQLLDQQAMHLYKPAYRCVCYKCYINSKELIV